MEPVKYARNGDVHLAYTTVGEGPHDVVWIPGWFSDFELGWQVPGLDSFLDDLADVGRLIVFDKRGTGQSDRVVDDRYPTLEERVGDVLAVMDAAGSERAALVGCSEGGSQALLTAARCPERVTAVVAIDSWARLLVSADDPGFGITQEQLDAFMDRALQVWGTGRGVGVFAPSRVDDPLFVERWASLERRAASPSALEAYGRLLADVDLCDVLSEVAVPTLVIHAVGDRIVSVDQSRYLAAHLPDARLVELPSDDHLPFLSHPEVVVDEIQRHLLGGDVSSAAPRRRFAAVLFSDIVGSTELAAVRGDRAWRSVLDGYEAAARRVVEEHDGTVVKATGDGTLATFDDPQSALLAARQLHREVDDLGVEVRAGLHCGQVELRDDDVGGIAVHIAARVAALAPVHGTLVSSTLRDVVLGSGLEFTPAGAHELRGVPGEWDLFELDAG